MRTSDDGSQIKRELYKSYLILTRTLYAQSEPTKNAPHIGAHRYRLLVGSITFLAFAMESFINDFGDRYVDDFGVLEKVDTLNKYIIFPKLSRSDSTQIVLREEAYYANLKDLFKYRNTFVHYKPHFRKTDSSDERLLTDLTHDKVSRLYASMVQLLIQINTQFHMFEDDHDWLTNYSTSIDAGT